MVPLNRYQLPASKDELAAALEEELRRHVHKRSPMVEVRSRVWPYIDEISVNLDRATIDPPLRPPPAASGARKPAFEIGVVRISARSARVHGLPIDLQCEARDVFVDQVADANDWLTLVFRSARVGQLTFSVAQLDLEDALTRIASDKARERGVTIEQVRLALRQRSARSIAGEARIHARKFIRAKIDIQGQLDIDDAFVATLSQLRCKGEGAIASRACSALQPHLDRLNNRTLSLKSLPLGDVELENLQLAVAETVELRVDFAPRA